MTTPSTDEDMPASSQVLLLFGTLLILGFGIIGNIPNQSQADIEIVPTQDPHVISNPQINMDENPNPDADVPAMPVAMFNLENPNGWESPNTVTLVGTFQDELGCEADLSLGCDVTNMTYDSLGDIWRISLELPAGEYLYRAHLDKSETRLYGRNGISGDNSFPIELILDTAETIHFYYDHKTGWITDNVNSTILTLPSNFQDEVGCKEEWNAGCFRTWMQDPEGDDIYTYETLHIPGGSWEARVALNGDIEASYGQGESLDGDNIPIWVPNIGHLSVFTWDDNLKSLTVFVSNVPIRLSTDLPAIAPNE